jgi:DNA-binding CsgD family transcriptional regulator/PAS domain-containing protein
VSTAELRRPIEHEDVFCALHEIAVSLVGVRDTADLARQVAEQTRQLLRAQTAGVWLSNETSGELRLTSPTDRLVDGFADLVATCYAQGRPIVQTGEYTTLAMPLIVAARPIGVLAARKAPQGDSAREAEVMTLLAAFVAPALEAARLHTESERQRQSAIEQGRRLAAILEQLPSGVFVLDARGMVLLANPAARRMCGPQLVDNLPFIEQTGRYRSRDPLSRRPLRLEERPSARVLAGQVVERAEVLVWQPERQADYWLRVDGVPLRDANGAVSGAVLVYTDVTRERTLARDLAATALEHAQLLGRLADRKARLERLAEPWLPDPGTPLTRRERELLRLIARGQTNREIGAALHLSPGTVRNQIGRLLVKLGATDRTQAAVLAVTRGLLEAE